MQPAVGSEPVIALHIGLRLHLQPQWRGRRFNGWHVAAGLQPSQHVEHMLAAGLARLQGQLGGHHHRFEAVDRDGRQHLSHDPVTTLVAQQDVLQLTQDLWQGLEWGTIAQGPRLALDQADVVPPVVEGLVALKASGMAGHPGVVSHHVDPCQRRSKFPHFGRSKFPHLWFVG